jgi:C-terminal processing protease CtpA/Prc
MWKFLICVTALTFSGSSWAEQSERDQEELRQEIKQAKRELRDASQKLERLTERQLPALRNAFNYNYSIGGKRPMVGIIMSGSERNSGGVLLSGITPDAPADKAGLESGDLLTHINGQGLSGRNGQDLANELLADLEVGEAFEFTYERDGESHTATVVVEEHEPAFAFNFSGNGDIFDFDSQPFNFGFNFDNDSINIDLENFRDLADRYRDLAIDASKSAQFQGLRNLPYVWSSGWAWSGLELKQVNAELGRYFGTDTGALVLAADNLGDSDLESGDVIISIEGDEVDNPQQAMRFLRHFKPGEQISTKIMRDGKKREVVLIAPEASSSSYSFSWSSEDEE